MKSQTARETAHVAEEQFEETTVISETMTNGELGTGRCKNVISETGGSRFVAHKANNNMEGRKTNTTVKTLKPND